MEDESSRAQLMREARSASAPNHPNICTIYEVGEDNGRAFIAMEYVDGRPLRDVVEAGPCWIELTGPASPSASARAAETS